MKLGQRHASPCVRRHARRSPATREIYNDIRTIIENTTTTKTAA